MKRIIMLAGKARSGKDTSARILKQLDPTTKLIAFASPMKNIISTTFNIPMTLYDDWKNDGRVCMHGIPMEDQEDKEFIVQSYRDIIQRFGTEAMQETFGKDVWAKLAVEKIKEYFEFTNTVVITDFRFRHEYSAIFDAFSEETDGETGSLLIDIVTVQIVRALSTNSTHVSENDLNDFDFDFTIENNGTIEELKNKLKVLYV